MFIKNSRNIFNKFKIIIIDDISTAICEILYVGVPFILIERNLVILIIKQKKILALKKIKILFENKQDKGLKEIIKNYSNGNA